MTKYIKLPKVTIGETIKDGAQTIVDFFNIPDVDFKKPITEEERINLTLKFFTDMDDITLLSRLKDFKYLNGFALSLQLVVAQVARERDIDIDIETKE